MIASSVDEHSLPLDTEARLASFTELVATAIANAENFAELTASRARVVAAADETRRRIERDLHDGTQQRLVSLGLELRLAQSLVPTGLGELEAEVGKVADELNGVVEDLREIARGIHPAILSEGGLGPALRTLARRAAIAVELDVAALTAAAGAGRGGGVLRRLGGAHERDQARARLGGRGRRGSLRRHAPGAGA